jgi:hypothetical protein
MSIQMIIDLAGPDFPDGYKRLIVVYDSKQHEEPLQASLVFDPQPLAFANALEAMAISIRAAEKREKAPKVVGGRFPGLLTWSPPREPDLD